MVETDWNGAFARGRDPERDEAWAPFHGGDSEIEDGDDGDDADGEGRGGEGRGDASAFVTGRRPEGPRLTERATGAMGALTALALVAGLGVWTWDLAVRDLSGVPVVRALEGPARVAPDEPGGEVAEHQGLAVNAIQAEGEDEPVPERLVLAPGAQGLASDDMAPRGEGDVVARADAEPARGTAIGPAPGSAVVMLASAETGAAEARPWGGARIDSQPEADPIEAALAEALGLPAPEAEADAAPHADAAAVVAPGGGVERSPRPSSRPEAPAADGAALDPTPVAARVVEPAPVAAGIAAPAPVAAGVAEPTAMAAGTWLVQLGAYPAEAVARAEWTRLASAQDAYLSDLAPVVSRASSGGRDFWRLRAGGFAQAAQARRLCAALTAEGLDCVPVMVR